MQQNIELSLGNVVKLEDIQESVDSLSQQARVFRRQGGELKNRLWWSNIKVCSSF